LDLNGRDPESLSDDCSGGVVVDDGSTSSGLNETRSLDLGRDALGAGRRTTGPVSVRCRQ